jgi:hypothetical protein
MLSKRLAVLVAAAVMVLSMLAASAPVFAQGEGGCAPQPGQTEKADAPISSPPQGKLGEILRNPAGDVHDTTDGKTGFGDRVDACA